MPVPAPAFPMALIAEAAITAQRPWAGLSASWRWQIVRRGKPMGVRIDGGAFTAYQAARLAGSRAVADFLEQVELESIRPE